MIRRSKYIQVAERLASRIHAGDYHLSEMPAGRDLAQEIGVSLVTARKAIQHLIDEGLLSKRENGRIEISSYRSGGDCTVEPQVALLAPAWESSEVTRWQSAMTQLQMRGRKFRFRTIHYAHWDDPLIFTSLENFAGVFFLPVPEPMPTYFLPKLLRIKKRVVTLGADWTEHGIPSVRIFPGVFVQRLMDHLVEIGRTRINCFNVQPMDSVIEGRITQWRLGLAAHGLSGELWNEPVKPYTETIGAAYDVMVQKIKSGKFHADGLICMTERVAAGAMRAMYEHGIRAGHDVAVCSVDGNLRAAYSVPSLTCLEAPPLETFLSIGIDWMLDRDKSAWQGPLLIQPDDVPLAVRESTVPRRS